MQLRDANKLNLHDPVGQHLDWFNIEQAYEDSGPATIESLLTHSSGLPRESDYPYWNGPDFPFPTRAQIIDRLAEQETLYPAQHYFQYSNLALTLAGEIVQESSGQDYADYIKEKILVPLGLKDTRTYFPEDLHGEQLAIGYTGLHRSGTRDPVAPFYTRGVTAAAGFTSSVRDLARFASWHFRLLETGDDNVLRANTLREMQRVHWVDPDWETTWGLGYSVEQLEDQTVVGHGGGCPGYITEILMIPKHKIAAIVLTNAGDGPAYRSAMNLLQVFGAAVQKAATPAAEDTPDFSMYEGDFEMRPWGGETAIRQWGDKLVAIDVPGHDLKEAMTKLEHDGGHTFTRLTDGGDRREPWIFEVDASGKATRIVQHSSHRNRIN
jgi:CubicO group peptidase (beta-lactamase class C family)